MMKLLVRNRIVLVTGMIVAMAVGFWAANACLPWIIRMAAIAGEEFAPREDGGRYAVNDLIGADLASVDGGVVYFADSTNDSVPSSDEDKRMISAMLGDELARYGISSYGLSFPGAGLDWIYTLLGYWVTRAPGLEGAVIPINLRWTSPAWREIDLNTVARSPYEYYASDLRLFPWLVDMGYRSPVQRADKISENAVTVVGPVSFRVNQLDAGNLSDERGITTQAARNYIYRQRFALAYGFELAEDDVLFDLLSEMQARCQAHHLKCLFYLPPFNLQKLTELSPEVAATLRRNIEMVRAYLDRNGMAYLNLADTMSPEVFHDVVNEHVRQRGRQFIASCLATAFAGRGDDLAGCPNGNLDAVALMKP